MIAVPKSFILHVSLGLPLRVTGLRTLHIPIVAADFSGPAVSILDGDTLEVLHNQHPERIHLSGIDCPEKGQAFGKRAKQAASGLAFGKDVTIQTHGRDKYKRTLGEVILLDGRSRVSLSEELSIAL